VGAAATAGLVAGAEPGASVDIPWEGIPHVVADIRFSPDGQWIAVVFTEDADWFKHPATMNYKTRIYDVGKRKCAYRLNFGETTAWSADGSLIAVGNGAGDKVILWDVKSGTVADTLQYIPTQNGIMKRLAFGQAGNLYGAIEGSTDEPQYAQQVLSAQVWWKAKRSDTKEPSQIKSACGLGCPLDLSVAQVGRDTRVAIAKYDGIKIVRVTKGDSAQPTIIPEHEIKGLKHTFVCLTPDGRRLVVCGEAGVSLFELGAGEPRPVFEDKKKIVPAGLWDWFFLYFPTHHVDVSGDSRLFVIPAPTSAEIILAKNGQLVAALPGVGTVALSPDGQFVAGFAKAAKGGVLRLHRIASLPKK
jgi:WD40 repeat protein